MTCNTNVCKAECCKFISFVVKRENHNIADLKHYYGLHGVTVEEKDGFLYLKIPLSCNALNKERCGVHETKPLVCREYPCGFDPFVSKKLCSQM